MRWMRLVSDGISAGARQSYSRIQFGRRSLTVVTLLVHAVAREFIRNCFLKFLCGCKVSIAAGSIALFDPGQPAPVKRACHLRFDAQRRTCNRRLPNQTDPSSDRSSRASRRSQHRPADEKRLVAVFQRRLQFADDCTGPATSVPHRFQTWVEPDRIVIVPCRALIIVPLLVCFCAIGKSPSVIGTEFDGLVEILDCTVVVSLLLDRRHRGY